MNTRIICVALSFVFLTGCGTKSEIKNHEPEQATSSAAVMAITTPAPVTEQFAVFIEKPDYKLSVYEPTSGCYLGAYILANSGINFEISEFEALTAKQHAMYSYYSSVSSNFPITWLLSCISLSKTPNIVLKPKSENLSDTDAELIKTAKELGEFYVPMFVQFAPIDKKYDAEKYIEYYRRARDIFREYASNTAFVFTVDAEDVNDCRKFYPGDEYVDWVGINMYDRLENGEYSKNFFSALDYFYFSFQRSKPIMLTEVAVSHLSNADYVYKNSEASKELERVFKKLENYPRVKALTYMDVNAINMQSTKAVRDNFMVTEEVETLAAYQKATKPSRFLSQVEISQTGDLSPELFKSPFAALKIGDEFFISRKTVEFDMNIQGAVSYLELRTIAGQDFFGTDKMEELGLGQLTIDETNKIITLRDINNSR